MHLRQALLAHYAAGLHILFCTNGRAISPIVKMDVLRLNGTPLPLRLLTAFVHRLMPNLHSSTQRADST